MKNAKFIHFIGIGGISMSGLATIMLKKKIEVSGSDMQNSHIIERLKKQGAKITLGHKADNIKFQDLVVFSGAIKNDNVELIRARELGIPCIERSEFLGYVSNQYKTSIAVGGTHGKTTTTAMLSKCFIEARLNPAVHLGGEVDFLKGSVRNGKNIFISEACEYRKSFLRLKKDYAILLNIEADHLDYYKTMENLQCAFMNFANKAGTLITTYELSKAIEFQSKKIITVSLFDKNANFYIKNLSLLNCGGHCFEVYKNGEFYYNFTLNVIGEFNVLNALCVIALCDDFNIDKATIHKALITYNGAKRRFEHLGVVNNAQVIHDYAHHPTEINKVILGFRSFYKGELIVVFQPHTYSRTKDLLNEFVTILSSSLIDTLIILPTYSAREKPEQGLSGQQLQEEVKKHKKEAYYMSFKKAHKFLIEKSFSNNVAILILGAGNIENFAKDFVKRN